MFMTKQTLGKLLLLICAVQFLSCQDADGPPGFIVLRNDIQDSQYNIIVVDQIVGKEGLTPYRYLLKPGQKQQIPKKEIRALRFQRQYKDFTRVYHVECPAAPDESITLKLIDVHTNRAQGGCKLVKKGRKEVNGAMVWEDEDE